MSLFLQQLARRVLYFDGAMGTSIHEYPLDIEKDYLGRENCTEALVLGRPDVIQEIHESYLAVGSDVVETDTFNGNVITMADQDLSDRVREINIKAAQIARAACDKFSTPDKPRFVAGSIGPGTQLITLNNTTWDKMLESYTEQVRGLIEGGVDVLLIETAQDLLQVKCTVNACLNALNEAGKTPDDIPIMVQVTIEQTGTMLMGTEIAAVVAALKPYPILSLGMNCATGPTEMTEHVRYLSEYWGRAISILPNAGIPTLVEGRTEFPLAPDSFASQMKRFVKEFGVNIVGGCCGTRPAHIQKLIETVGLDTPQVAIKKKPLPAACTSLYSTTDFRQDTSILNVGERTNASGSRAFKKLLEKEDWDGMVSLAREQTREGSHVIDVNVDYAGRNNAHDMADIVHRFVRQVNAPLMLDSTQPATIEAGLKCAGGKCIINSANLEDGEEKFAQMIRLAKVYGAALVFGTIDEDPEEAMARTADRKESIAARMRDMAMNKYGLPEEDIFFDPLVLPISTGMDKDRRSALETIEGVRRISTRFPNCQTTVGLSNVSFGLKPAARVVLNSAFMHELVAAGLTSAIVHSSKILPKNRIPDAQWNAAIELIYNRWPDGETTLKDGSLTKDPLQIFINLFDDDQAAGTGASAPVESLTLEEQLQRHIIDGEKKNLIETLEEARTKYTPLQIINDHLLAGMKVVGELFGSGQMQLPFVLQSAEVMKMAVAHLEKFMDKVEGETKGKVVLATVKGDVHDIGKNLVDIILTNNGYTVYNLGIKQPISTIIEAWRTHKADAIGMSGLLVKSVNVMEENLNELNTLGVNAPILLGGAALSKHYCESHLRSIYKGKVYHGRDAFEGLRIMDLIQSGKGAEIDGEIEARLTKRADVDAKLEALEQVKLAGAVALATMERSSVRTDLPVPKPPYFGDRIIEKSKLDDIYAFVNKVALYRGQWQFKKGKQSQDDYDAQLWDEIDPIFDRLKKQCKEENILQPQVVYGYFPCSSDGDDLIVYDAIDHDKEIERFSFPRQPGRQRLCISDFFRARDTGEKDVIGLTCVTMGHEASKRTKALFESNNYAEYLYLHGMAVECAEALAEMWHKRVRQELGIADEDSPKVRDLFTQHYRGSRYSFGYPACPDMSDQEKLFRLLKPERIGCLLTENWQIDPEQSTSAIIVHHPEAKYFNV